MSDLPFVMLVLVWWGLSLWFAVWAWRKSLDLHIGPLIFAAVFTLFTGPLTGIVWWLCWWDEERRKHKPFKTRKPLLRKFDP